MKLDTLKTILRVDSLRRHSGGFCSVCHRRTVFLITDAVKSIRNNAVCVRCRSCSRNRHLVHCLLECFAAREIASLADFRARPEIAVFNASNQSPIARALGTGKNLYSTEYFEDVAPGESKNGVRCENLERLTFGDASIDLAITEDVFEHVRDYEKGFSELWRVLKPGGYHVFTVPFYFDQPTASLFKKRGEVYELLEPVEYHGDHLRGKIPVYHRFGYDLFAKLEKIGFATRLARAEYYEAKQFGTFDCYTFVSYRI
jgi:SAM-dependent methyltransferase